MKKILLLSAIAVLFAANAHATGGAYTSTKHGGGTVDGVPGSGVNRGVNLTDYPGGQYLNTTEGGIYQAGECAHCHEPHASFGGTEPLPNLVGDAGPDAYLAMKEYGGAANYSNLCWYCHENLALNAKPLGHGYWNFYWGKTYYQAAGHYNNFNFAWPGTTGDPVAIWPRQNRSLLPGGNKGSCVNCHTPHGIKGTSLSQFDTTAVPAAKQTVASGNPDVSADYLIPRQAIAWEEALCENCHKSGVGQPYTDAKAIKEQLDCLNVSAATPCGGIGGSTTQGSGHPVHNVDQAGGIATTFSGRHTLKNENTPISGSWNAYSSVPVSRHVECVDCHNPHAAQNATVFQQSGAAANPNRISDAGGVKAGGTNKGVWGINVTTTTGATTPLTRVDDANSSAVNYSSLYLYEICLKCHSVAADNTIGTATSPISPSWTNRTRWQPTPGSLTDDTFLDDGSGTGTFTMRLSNVATDFATGQLGYHPLFAAGKNQPLLNANPFWVTNGTYTGACALQNVVGTGAGKRTDTAEASLTQNFVPPWTKNSLVTCVDCHESEIETSPRGPHGSSRPFILRKLNPNISYTICTNATCATQTPVSYSSLQNNVCNSTAIKRTVNLGTQDPNNLCLNCHRADVYGYWGITDAISVCGTVNGPGVPYFRRFSRQPHPAEVTDKTYWDWWGKSSDSVACGLANPGAAGDAFMKDDSGGRSIGGAPGAPPRGIFCLRCHGGGTVGGIHGNSGAVGFTNAPGDNRLINGGAWTGWTKGSTTTQGTCTKNGLATLFNSCQEGSAGAFGDTATYNY